MIEVRNVKKSFNDVVVLDGLNIAIMKGETLVIIGRSGCGKSVFLKHIIGILKPEEGEILVDGVNIVNLSPKAINQIRMRFGMVFQGSALFDSMTMGENVGFALRQHTNLGEKTVHGRVEEALELVGLKGTQDLRPAELSGGMKKRAAIARAICMRPEILLYDEPTTGLDPIMADAINDLIRKMHDRLKITSLAVTHDMKSAYKIASRIAMMYQGKIIQIGTPDTIRDSANPVVQQFIAGSAQGPMSDVAFKSFEQIEGDPSS